MKYVKYAFEDGNENRIVINYDGINRALNGNEIGNFQELITKGYIWFCDKDSNKIETPEGFNFNKVMECAEYQMQTKLKGSSNDLDDEERIEEGGFIQAYKISLF